MNPNAGYTPDPKQWISGAHYALKKGVTLLDESIRRNSMIYFANASMARSFLERELEFEVVKKHEQLHQHTQMLRSWINHVSDNGAIDTKFEISQHLKRFIHNTYYGGTLSFSHWERAYLHDGDKPTDKPLMMMELLNCIHGPTVAKLKMDLSRLPTWSYRALARA